MTGVAWLLAFSLASVSAEPQPEDWEWLSSHRFLAFESLMPVKAEPQTWATYFSYRDLYQEVSEAYFTIRSENAASLPGAVVITPVGRSIQQQLLDQHTANRSLPYESALAHVKVHRRTITPRACAAISEALDSLTKLRIRMPERNIVVLHPTVHRVIVQFGGGTLDVSLQEDDHPLAQWGRRTLAELEKCPSAE